MTNIDRRNPEAKHGLVNFPTHLRNTGEGGMTVFAVWPVVDNAVCAVDVVFYPFGNILDSWWERERQEALRDLKNDHPGTDLVPEIEWDEIDGRFRVVGQPVVNLGERIASGLRVASGTLFNMEPMVPFAGAVYLGSSGGSWYDDEQKDYWCASLEDLTEEGAELVRLLNWLYGSECKLITVLDT